jgi:hypothetical protein
MWIIIPIIIPFGLISRSYHKLKQVIRRRRHRRMTEKQALADHDLHHTVLY